ncbi:unnamed protein product [Nippostrongylus brasiliensis]|uniref:TPT domain-containing protein n=1 Tax=Nippostrongylus brasiliensis TaxID=27835 RepID=A0A0N4XEK9_NIPBR|nr:unnamed protein product [Nippostrongylus brasiliensis]
MLRRHNKPGGSPSQQNSVFIAEGVRVKPSHYIAEDLATQGAQASTPAPAENAATPGAVPSNVTASRSQGSMHSGRNCGYFVFLAITLLTCIHNSIRAMLVGYGASDWSILKFCAMSELLLTIAVFILKVVSITFAEKVCIRIACLAVMQNESNIAAQLTEKTDVSGGIDLPIPLVYPIAAAVTKSFFNLSELFGVEAKTLKIPNVVARNIGSGEFLSEKEGIKSFKPSASLMAAKTQSAEKEKDPRPSKELSASMEKPMLNSAEKEKGTKFSNAEKEKGPKLSK